MRTLKTRYLLSMGLALKIVRSGKYACASLATGSLRYTAYLFYSHTLFRSENMRTPKTRDLSSTLEASFESCARWEVYSASLISPTGYGRCLYSIAFFDVLENGPCTRVDGVGPMCLWPIPACCISKYREMSHNISYGGMIPYSTIVSGVLI